MTGLEIRGGPGGTAARLDDLDRAGAGLQAAARVMTAVALRAARVATDPGLLVSAPASPLTWSAVQGRLARAIGPPAGAVVVATRLTALGAAARGAVRVYRATDSSVEAGLRALDVAVGRALGTFVAVPLVAAVVTSPFAVTTGVAEVVGIAGLADPPGSQRVPEVLLRGLATCPGAVEHAVGALPGVFAAIVDTDPGLALAVAGVTGLPGIPPDVPGAAGWLGRLGSAGPWLRESTDLQVAAGPVRPARPPAGLENLLEGVAAVGTDRGTPPGTVRVVAVTRPGGQRSWIVHIPGTQDWSPRAGPNPLDLTGNVHGLAGRRTAGRALIESSLREAGARPGEPVLLAGHSQGGIVAAQLAADPAFRASYRVTHVITAGAPVASVPVPDSVAVLSLEHHEDLVARLDGARNPDRPTWITVSRGTADAGGPNAAQAHDLSAYARTAAAVDGSPDPGLARWRAGLEPFLAAPGVTATEMQITGRRQ